MPENAQCALDQELNAVPVPIQDHPVNDLMLMVIIKVSIIR